ncbi:M10 family metallopeptidase C-terminal domain-containing protein [Paracoccus benzoatiresistens]|uniref:M10 family metallopeptidase C-terminal domain-containing protein n=1 Tax=Paracoccus benzoatiresistens TaxID=2997341 RepID=UPI0035302ED5
MVGTDGDDLLVGAGGKSDRLTGGEGADTFFFGFEVHDGVRTRSTITDFEVGIDSISLAAGVTIDEIKMWGKKAVVYLDNPCGPDDVIQVRGEGVCIDNLTFRYDDLLVGA